MTRLRNNPGLVAYLILSATIVVALVGYQRHANHHFNRDNKRFEKADAASCLNRRLLITNQAVVLAVLERNAANLAKIPGPAQKDFLQSLREIRTAQHHLALTPHC